MGPVPGNVHARKQLRCTNGGMHPPGQGTQLAYYCQQVLCFACGECTTLGTRGLSAGPRNEDPVLLLPKRSCSETAKCGHTVPMIPPAPIPTFTRLNRVARTV